MFLETSCDVTECNKVSTNQLRVLSILSQEVGGCTKGANSMAASGFVSEGTVLFGTNGVRNK